MANTLIGTCGYVYNHWREVFYPRGLATTRWLAFYSKHFSTVELNNSFYMLPKRSTFADWASRTPDNFVFAVKGNRFITHVKYLNNREALERMYENCTGLGSKLGPILFQLPPSWKLNIERLEMFLSWLDPANRHVMEFRNETWLDDRVYDLLKKSNVAFCIHDKLPKCPTITTADFAYVRFHGDSTQTGSYEDDALSHWAEVISEWAEQEIDAYAYFNNDAHGYAVQNAQSLKSIVAASAREPVL